MILIVQSLIVATTFFAIGIFYTLSFVEKRAWRIMLEPMTKDVSDESVFEIDRTLQSIVDYVPLTMKAIMGTLFILLVLQAWLNGWALLPVSQLTVFVLAAGVGLRQVFLSINQLQGTTNNRSAASVRRESSKVYLVHHGGLALSLLIGITELILFFG